MGYQWVPNGSSALELPNAGNMLAPDVVRVVVNDLVWHPSNYLFGQVGSSSVNREFGLYRSNTGGTTLNFMRGNVITVVTEDFAGTFGSNIPRFDKFEIIADKTNLTYTIIGDGEVIVSGSFINGTNRMDEVFFRVGARGSTADAGTGSTSYISSGARVGDIEVYFDGELAAYYEMPASGTVVEETTTGRTGVLLGGDGTDWKNAEFVPLVNPLQESINVVVLGASIMDQTFRTTGAAAMEAELLSKGITATVYNRAVSGHTSTQGIGVLHTALGEFAGQEHKTLFVIHTLGNDISNEGPYPGGEAGMDERYRYILNEIKAEGFTFLPSTVSYRIPNASNPAEPYNVNVVIPAIQDIAPWAMNGDRPYMDLHKLSFDNQETWHDVDNLHPSDAGEEMNRQYIAQVIADYTAYLQANPIDPDAGGPTDPVDPTDPPDYTDPGPIGGWSEDRSGWEFNNDGWHTDATARGDWAPHLDVKIAQALAGEGYTGTLEEMLIARAEDEGFESYQEMLDRVNLIPKGTHPW